MYKTLRRLDDDFRIHGYIQFVEFDSNTGSGKKLHNSIIVGGSAIVDWESGKGYIWQTSNIIEKISETEFKTKNSHYVLEDTNHDLLKKLQIEVQTRRPFTYERRVNHAIDKPLIREVRTEAQIKASLARAIRVFDAIDKAKGYKKTNNTTLL